MSLKKLIVNIKRHKHFLITTHLSPEGDALGSELAFYLLLKILGKEAIIVNEDKTPAEYDFLPGITKINNLSRKIKNFDFDCFVALDCSDMKRCGKIAQLNTANKISLNIDHHISNKFFADVNWVDPEVSSASEMVYKLYKKMRLPLNKDIALLLYVGILTDTGSFRYISTSPYTHQAAADLMRYGLNAAQIYKNSYENIPFEDMKLLARIISNLKREFGGKVIWFQAKRGIFKDKKGSFDLAENVLSFARAIKDAEVVVLFKENLAVKNEIRVNFRSQGRVDVNMIARFFGGGGHKTASGATITGSIEEARKKVLNKIGQSLR